MLHVVNVVMIRGPHTLVEWRDDSVFSPGHWVFPGGKIEPGESPDAAIIREITEELGILPFALDGIGVVLTDYDTTLYPYIVTRWAGDLPANTLDAGSMLRWLPLDQIADGSWKPAADIVRKVADRLGRVLSCEFV